MKTLRLMVVGFSLSTLGLLSLAPRTGHGQDSEYNKGYQQGMQQGLKQAKTSAEAEVKSQMPPEEKEEKEDDGGC
jgi:hypothetical protein